MDSKHRQNKFLKSLFQGKESKENKDKYCKDIFSKCIADISEEKDIEIKRIKRTACEFYLIKCHQED